MSSFTFVFAMIGILIYFAAAVASIVLFGFSLIDRRAPYGAQLLTLVAMLLFVSVAISQITEFDKYLFIRDGGKYELRQNDDGSVTWQRAEQVTP